MRYFNLIFVSCLSAILLACRSEGSSTVPEIPDDPDGVKRTIIAREGAAVYLDDTGNGIVLGADGCLQGEDVFFAPAVECIGISYISRISASSWNAKSSPLRKGYGFVMGSKMADGATFTSVYVDDIDSISGKVTLKTLSPFYGDAEKFYFNHKGYSGFKSVLFAYSEPCDTIVVLTKPVTYNVELASGDWVSLKPYITYVRLNIKENYTGNVRVDTLIFSNGLFQETLVPIVQYPYRRGDDILSPQEE